jgi:hypothetical protein
MQVSKRTEKSHHRLTEGVRHQDRPTDCQSQRDLKFNMNIEFTLRTYYREFLLVCFFLTLEQLSLYDIYLFLFSYPMYLDVLACINLVQL